ncbi:TolB-like protein [Rhizobium subbaraonis]|uniref:TolB-like protein n=1 Tax=Rhizobium subbaraonis TaxID=908946 RepID=A0A285U6N5_9HYPH|nr:hypothetical protein [Rhizobium subbaraonis]SOC35911.1 TolB-like protein [Rhizobium subbaraonis]
MSLVHQGTLLAEVETPPSDREVRAQLAKIQGSSAFEAPERARRFLTYVVDETLQGRSDRIKAFSIAVEVFGRDASFDAQNDPVVRIEAGRVRRSLERYYLLAGQNDPIIITMPKGGYVPVFTRFGGAVARPQSDEGRRTSVGSPPALPRQLAWAVVGAAAVVVAALVVYTALVRPATELARRQNSIPGKPGVATVLIEPFKDLTDTRNSSALARGLTDEVIGQMARFREITVVTKQADPGGKEDTSQPHGGLPFYALEGSVRTDEQKIRLSVRLLDRADNSVIWSNSYDRQLQVSDVLAMETDIARSVVTALAQPYGVIFQTDAARLLQSPPDDWDAYACTLSYYGYRANLDSRSHAAVQNCLLRAAEKYPDYATAWALLSLTYLDEYRFRYHLRSPAVASIDRAAETAKRAVELDPENLRALEAEMLAYFFQGNVETALSIGARGISINPNDTEFAAEYGFRLALAGEWDRGCAMVSDALGANPGPLGYFEAALAVCAYVKGDYGAAEKWARMSDLASNPIYRIIMIAILGQRGEMQEAAEQMRWLEINAPEFVKDPAREVRTRIHRPEDQAHFIDGLKKAGMALPSPASVTR